MTLRHATRPSRLGPIAWVADGGEVLGIYFVGHWRKPQRASAGVEAAPDDPVIARAAAQLDEWLEGERRGFDIGWRLEGSDLERSVWALLLAIPYGETTTYGAIARRLGNPHLAQEVGRCVGENPLSIVVPCHRVVGSDGSLTGYAGGLERKAFLLDLEGYLTGRTLLDPRIA